MALRTAFIGAGAIAHCHGQALRELGVEIHGVFDIVPENAKKCADAFGAKAFDRVEDMLDGVDMVHLLTPPSKRVEYAEKVMKAGKHLVIEKPIAVTVEDGEKMVALAKQCGVRMLVGFSHRFREGYVMLRQAANSGRLGRVVNVFMNRFGYLGVSSGAQAQSWRTNPGLACGMTIESLSHDIDLILQIAPDPVAVEARVLKTLPELPQLDNNVNAVFSFESGATAVISASWSSYLKFSSRGVVGTLGAATLNGADLFDFDEFRIRTRDMTHEESLRLDDAYKFFGCSSYLKENRHFVDCVANGAPSEITGEYGLRILKISHAILESAETGRPVDLER